MSNHQKKTSVFSWMTTYYTLFAFLIVGLEMFSAGTDVHTHNYPDLVFNLIISAFWAGLALFFGRMTYRDGYLDGELFHLERTGELLEAVAEYDAELDAMHSRAISKIIKDSEKNGDIKVKTLLENARKAGYKVEIGIESKKPREESRKG